MNTGEIKQLFKDFTDEADTTFITAANVELYCQIGYDQFRRKVSEYDPFFYTQTFTFDVSSGNINLSTQAPVEEAAVFLLGSGATPTAPHGKMSQLIRVGIQTSSNRLPDYWMAGATSEEDLINAVRTYLLKGQTLHFGEESLSTTVRLDYVPVQNIAGGWAAAAAFIDDLSEFHDLIALYAYGNYAIRDGAPNPIVDAQLLRREQALISYLSHGRSQEAANHVSYVP